MTTDEISGKPRVPVGELREKVEDWIERSNSPVVYDYDGAAYKSCADELEALIERYDYE